MLIAILAAAIAASPAGELSIFRDWVVGCDNRHACHATTLAPEPTDAELQAGDDAVADNYFGLSLKRAADALAPLRIRLLECYLCDVQPGIEPARVTELQVKDKGGAVIGRITFGPEQAADLFADEGLAMPADADFIGSLAKGEIVEVYDDDARYMASISLRGLSSALQYLDENQRRMGTVTALVGRGKLGADSVPQWSLDPIILTPPISDAPPTRPRDRTLLHLQEKYRCDGATKGLPEYAIDRLDAHSSMLLIFGNCAPYNGEGYVFVIDRNRKVRKAAMRLAPGSPAADPPQIISGYWDRKERRLHSFARGRAFADCGQEQEFAWDGRQFLLVREADMGGCRGSIDYITVYRRETAIGGHRQR